MRTDKVAANIASNSTLNGGVSSQTNPQTVTPPVINTTSSFNLDEGVANQISGVSITDTSAGSNPLTVTLSDSFGLLNVDSNSGVTVTGADSNQLSLTGSLTAVNMALSTLTDTNNQVGGDAISIGVTDTNDTLTAQALQAVTVLPSLGGLTINGKTNDHQAINPFASLTINDNLAGDNVSASISFTAANGVLSGIGLSAAIIKNGIASYTLTATTPAALQQELNNLSFTPTVGQTALGSSVTTQFALNLTGGTVLDQTISQLVDSPNDLTFDSHGNLWVANLYSVLEFSASGIPLLTITHGLHFPSALTFDSQGNLWLENGTKVEEFSTSGTLLLTLDNGDTGLNSLTFDSHGNLWVANRFNNTVEEFSSSGTPLLTLTNGVSVPNVLTIDSHGNLWVANFFNIEEFSASGTSLLTLNGISSSGTLTFDSHGNLWVANYNIIEEYSASGTPLLTLSNGVNNPKALTFDRLGNLWFVNNNYGTVEEFSANGRQLLTLSNGNNDPTALTFDSHGNLWVANQGSYTGNLIIPSNVEEFSPANYSLSNKSTQVTVMAVPPPPVIRNTTSFTLSEGVQSQISGISITDAAAGNNPLTVTLSDSFGLLNVDSNSGITVTGANSNQLNLTGNLTAVNKALSTLTDTNNQVGGDAISISVTDTGDTLTAQASQAITVLPSLGGLTINGKTNDHQAINPFASLTINDNLAGDNVSASISFTAANGVLSGIGLSAATINKGIASYTLSATTSAALQQELNNLSFTPKVGQTAIGNTVTTQFALNLSGSSSNWNAPLQVHKIGQGINNPQALTFDSFGNLWVASPIGSAEGSIEEFSASGVPLLTLSDSEGFLTVITFDSHGDLWVANGGGLVIGSSVEEFSASGTPLLTISNISNLKAITFDSFGNLWVAEGIEFNFSGSVEEFSASGTPLLWFTNGISQPSALTFDSQGHLWVANSSNVEEFSASGTPLLTLSNGVYGATGLTFDSHGDLWVANSGNYN